MLGFVNNKLTSKADSTRARASMFRASEPYKVQYEGEGIHP